MTKFAGMSVNKAVEKSALKAERKAAKKAVRKAAKKASKKAEMRAANAAAKRAAKNAKAKETYENRKACDPDFNKKRSMKESVFAKLRRIKKREDIAAAKMNTSEMDKITANKKTAQKMHVACCLLKKKVETIDREDEEAAEILLRMQEKRRPQRTCTSTAKYTHDNPPLIEKKFIKGKGYGIFACEDVEPSTDIAYYDGEIIVSEEESERRLDQGNDKVLRVRMKNIWIDGAKSKTLAAFVNHACNCVSNCDILFEGGKRPVLVTKASQLGSVKKGEEFTWDYGIDPKDWPNDTSLNWLRKYTCPKCRKKTSNCS
jgi:hypothetical protein